MLISISLGALTLILSYLILPQKNPLPLPDATTVSLHHLIRNSASVTGEDAGSLLALALQQVRTKFTAGEN